MEEPGFWDDPEQSQEMMKKLKSMKDDIATYHTLQEQYEEIETLIEMAEEENAMKNLATIRKICYNLTKLDPFNPKLSFNKKLTLYNHDFNNIKKLIFSVVPLEY